MRYRDIAKKLKALGCEEVPQAALLVTAPTGFGKTREAGMLAQTMILEGWRGARLRGDRWLDLPKTLLSEAAYPDFPLPALRKARAPL